MTDITDYQWLVSEEASRWLSDCAQSGKSSHRLQADLRKAISAERARLIVQQVELRQKAMEKFGELANQMFFTDLALQQATDRWIAAYKATRFEDAKPTSDYCCGIGGDLIALAERGSTNGWDRSPEMAVFAAANLRAWNLDSQGQIFVDSVEDHPPIADQQWHLDPHRRSDGRRSTHLEWHSPNEETIRTWLATAPNGAIKLAPASQLNATWQQQAELEWISRDRQCRQLVAWFGEFAHPPGKHRATMVTGNSRHSFTGDPNSLYELAETVGEYVFDTDPAIRAARLTGALAVALSCSTLAPGEAYLTSNEPTEHPLLSCFRVKEVLPLRIPALAKHLRSLSIGELEIKTRGVSLSPEELRKKLKLSGSASATILLTRQGKREIAILAERQCGGVTDSAPNN
ncbi:MAG: class I SAM-dependent methyltransferase [Bythopirellula sp.]|nr:class I SAM-dependent methyltransferase [Bythopirellula sp.]